MNNRKEITLTEQELHELKDEIKFRERVILQLKQLNGVPKKVIKLEVHSGIHWALIIMILGGILGLTWKVLGR